VDEVDFGLGGGLVLSEVVGEKFGIGFGVFGGQDGEAAVVAGETVLETVLRGDGFAFFCFRTAGFLRVLTVGGETGRGDFREAGKGPAGSGNSGCVSGISTGASTDGTGVCC
jgi:hypothetical protein